MTEQISTSAITYANSLINADKNYDKILSDLNTISDVTNNSKDFAQTMLNPTISNQTKLEIIDEIFNSELSKTTLNFFKIIIEKNRFSQFDEIFKAYKNQIDKLSNIQKIEVTSAIELSETQKNKIKEKLKNKIHKELEIDWIKNKDIIGGLIIKMDDTVIDLSIKNKLYKLSKI